MMTKTTKATLSALGVMSLLGAAGVAAGAATTVPAHHGRSDTSHPTPVRHHAHGSPAQRAAHRARLESLAMSVHHIAVSGALPASFSCANAAVFESRISSFESHLDARLSWAQGAEQAAAAAGSSVRANHIALEIAQATQLRSDLVTVSGLISAECQV